MKIVALDPRITATTQISDLHLPLAAGTDVHLFNGLLVWLADNGAVDAEYAAAHQLASTRRWPPRVKRAVISRARRAPADSPPRSCDSSTNCSPPTRA